MRDAGHQVAFSVHEGSGRFAVPRRVINTRDSTVTFGAKLLPGHARLERMSAGRPGFRRLAARLARQRPGSGGGWRGTGPGGRGGSGDGSEPGPAEPRAAGP